MITDSKPTVNAENKLEKALQMMANEDSIESVLAYAPEEADWLRPLLELSDELGELRDAVPIPPPEASLQKMLAHANALAAAQPPMAAPRAGWWVTLGRSFSGGLFPRAATLVAAFLIAFLSCMVLGGGATIAAQNSLPGQPLYGLKRAFESLRLNLTYDPLQQMELQETFNQRRLEETVLLLQQGQQAKVVFEDNIQSVTGTTIVVSGLTIEITPETIVTGELLVDARVRVEVVTQPPSTLNALTITVIQPAPPTATPTPSPSATPTAAPTITPTPLPAPTQAENYPGDRIETLLPPEDAGTPDENSNDDAGMGDNSNDNEGENGDGDDGNDFSDDKNENDGTGDDSSDNDSANDNEDGGSDSSDNDNANEDGGSDSSDNEDGGSNSNDSANDNADGGGSSSNDNANDNEDGGGSSSNDNSNDNADGGSNSNDNEDDFEDDNSNDGGIDNPEDGDGVSKNNEDDGFNDNADDDFNDNADGDMNNNEDDGFNDNEDNSGSESHDNISSESGNDDNDEGTGSNDNEE